MKKSLAIVLASGVVIGAYTLGTLGASSAHASAPVHSSAASSVPSSPRVARSSPTTAAPVTASRSSSAFPTFHTVNIPNGGGGSFGLITLPGSWNPTPAIQAGQDGSVTDTWTHGGETVQFSYEAWMGANHNVAGGTDAFNPAEGLPPGMGIIGRSSPSGPSGTAWPVAGNGSFGFVATNSTMSGEYLVLGRPDTLSFRHSLVQIMNSVQLYRSDFQ